MRSQRTRRLLNSLNYASNIFFHRTLDTTDLDVVSKKPQIGADFHGIYLNIIIILVLIRVNQCNPWLIIFLTKILQNGYTHLTQRSQRFFYNIFFDS